MYLILRSLLSAVVPVNFSNSVNHMKIALYQMNCTLSDPAANLAKIGLAASEANASGAELLLVPELAITGYGAGTSLKEQATKADNDGLSDLCALSKKHDLAIVCGFSELDGGTVYNSAAFVSEGAVQGCYRKCQLWGPYEAEHFQPGEPKAVVIDYRGLKIGILICYDVEFPERVRPLAMAGADLIVVPTATPKGESANFIATKMISVRAFENQVFVAYANHHSSDGRFSYAGLSCIAAPNGELLAQADEVGDRLLTADIEPAAYTESRSENSYLTDIIE